MAQHFPTTAGAPCWVDLQTSDEARARAFYGELLGWEALEGSAEFGGYFMFARGGVPVAGGMAADAQAPVPDVWSVYLRVDDAAATLDAAAAAGAKIVVPPMAVGGMGTMGFLVDPAGAGIGVWQPGSFPGYGLVAEPGAPAWFETYTRDYEASASFYTDVFGWRTEPLSDTDEFRYLQVMGPDGAEAGLMDASGWLPEGEAPSWGVYFAVADADAAAEQVQRLGGTVLEPPADTPYGRIVFVADPMGARFRLVAEAAAPAVQA